MILRAGKISIMPVVMLRSDQRGPLAGDEIVAMANLMDVYCDVQRTCDAPIAFEPVYWWRMGRDFETTRASA